MAEVGGIEQHNVSVRDTRKSAAWYMKLLSLEQLSEEDSEEHGWIKIGL